MLADPPAIALPAEQLDEHVGNYRLEAAATGTAITYTIRRDGDRLIGQRSGRPAAPLQAELRDLFFVAGQPRSRKLFRPGPDGRATGFVGRACRPATTSSWGSELATAGRVGHNNSDSQRGERPAGRGILDRLVARI